MSDQRCQTWGYYTGRQCQEQEGHDGRHRTEPAVGRYSAGRSVQDDGLDAVWRVRKETDRSWTITDDRRPGFVTTGETLQEAVEDLLPVMALWDETDEMRRAAPPLHDAAGRSSDPEPAPDERNCFWHKRETGCRCHSITGAVPALQATGEPPHE